MKEKMPRILFAAPKSGSGKTMLACGMIEVCKRRGAKVAAFKCGPDYIDSMFHRKVLGVASGNLDTFFTGRETTRYLLSCKADTADITILEGVMGYYDGLGGQSDRASTYEVAKVTDTPVILVVDAKGASVSLAAVIQGIMEYREDSAIRGIILNRVSAGYYERLKDLIERECQTEVLGYLPELSGLEVPSRHLGLFAPEEIEGFEKWVSGIADAIEENILVERILAIAGEAEPCVGKKPEIPVLNHKVRLAVAEDEAFSFHYSENLQLLEQMGAELIFFSPLHDMALPEEAEGLLLPGGYPEKYVKELEEAEKIRHSIKKACQNGLPCLAECGGFLYLQKELMGLQGEAGEMAGVLSGNGFRTEKLCRFGYITLELANGGMLGEAGQQIRGHEFHYWDCTENGTDCTAKKTTGGKKYSCMVHTKSMAAGFPHLYYYSNPNMLYQFLLACEGFGAARQAKKNWDSIAKPIDSLGLLEDAVVRLCRIQGSPGKPVIGKRALLALCADHGVVKEGVTQTGSEVTRIVSENFAKGCSTVNFMAETAKVDVYAIDVGMDTPAYPCRELVTGAVIDRKIARGSGNIAVEAAMSLEQCRKAVETGIGLVRELKEKGYQILATGEMGIGNTTPTSALAAIFLQLSPEEVTGRGAGLTAEKLQRKYTVVEQIIERVRGEGLLHGIENCPGCSGTSLFHGDLKRNAFPILAQAGGYEIAVMAGVYLGGVRYQVPVVMDGAISTVAALVAMHLDERVADFVLASHVSEEQSGALALKALGVEALIHGRMCLGEGTGAMTVFPLLDMAVKVYGSMGSFEEYEIEAYKRYS